MSLFDAFSYQGKRVLVVGGATGMGAGVAEVARDAGAEVVDMDRAEITIDGVKKIKFDLVDKASIDAALAEAGGTFDALFCCAGVADGEPGIEKINFIGHRYIIEKMVAEGMLGKGSAIGMISSSAGLGWESNLEATQEILKISDFEEASKYWVDNNKANYMWSKMVMNTFVAQESLALMSKGIRLNAILPGPTDTPLARANAELWLGFGGDFREVANVEVLTPLEQAYPLVFLCSAAASGITGVTLVTDSGYLAAGTTGSFPPATPVMAFMRGPQQ